MNEISLNTLKIVSSKVFNVVEKINSMADKEKPYFSIEKQIGYCDVSLYSVKIVLYPDMDILHPEIALLLLPFFKNNSLRIGVCEKHTLYFAFDISL